MQPHLDGVGQPRAGGLGHEGDEQRGEERDHPEHDQRHLGPVHTQLHDEGRDLAGEVVVTTLLCYCPVPVSHHGPDPRPEGAAAEAGCPHHGGEDLGGVDVADGEGVDGGHAPGQVQNQDGPLVCKL